jgi:hypothetical protein
VNIDRSGIKMAARLLAKAESTDSDPEAIALVERSYSLLADTINAYDLVSAQQSGPRRRERRRLFDRRSARRSLTDPVGIGPEAEQASAVNGYLRLGDGGTETRRSVDFSL